MIIFWAIYLTGFALVWRLTFHRLRVSSVDGQPEDAFLAGMLAGFAAWVWPASLIWLAAKRRS